MRPMLSSVFFPADNLTPSSPHSTLTVMLAEVYFTKTIVSNYKIKPSFCNDQSRHVSAHTSGHLQAILVILNNKIEVTIRYNGPVESNCVYIGKVAIVYVNSC
jgi:hypothetical protein